MGLLYCVETVSKHFVSVNPFISLILATVEARDRAGSTGGASLRANLCDPWGFAV